MLHGCITADLERPLALVWTVISFFKAVRLQRAALQNQEPTLTPGLIYMADDLPDCLTLLTVCH